MTKCPLCKKKPSMSNKRKLLRGNYNIVNRYKKMPNLQWANIYGMRVKACTTCVRTVYKA